MPAGRALSLCNAPGGCGSSSGTAPRFLAAPRTAPLALRCQRPLAGGPTVQVRGPKSAVRDDLSSRDTTRSRRAAEAERAAAGTSVAQPAPPAQGATAGRCPPTHPPTGSRRARRAPALGSGAAPVRRATARRSSRQQGAPVRSRPTGRRGRVEAGLPRCSSPHVRAADPTGDGDAATTAWRPRGDRCLPTTAARGTHPSDRRAPRRMRDGNAPLPPDGSPARFAAAPAAPLDCAASDGA